MKLLTEISNPSVINVKVSDVNNKSYCRYVQPAWAKSITYNTEKDDSGTSWLTFGLPYEAKDNELVSFEFTGKVIHKSIECNCNEDLTGYIYRLSLTVAELRNLRVQAYKFDHHKPIAPGTVFYDFSASPIYSYPGESIDFNSYNAMIKTTIKVNLRFEPDITKYYGVVIINRANQPSNVYNR